MGGYPSEVQTYGLTAPVAAAASVTVPVRVPDHVVEELLFAPHGGIDQVGPAEELGVSVKEDQIGAAPGSQPMPERQAFAPRGREHSVAARIRRDGFQGGAERLVQQRHGGGTALIGGIDGYSKLLPCTPFRIEEWSLRSRFIE
jgi:hypothetical protein